MLRQVDAWQRYEPSDRHPWNTKRAVHLLRRTAFGGTWDEIERVRDERPSSAISRLVQGQFDRPGGDQLNSLVEQLVDSGLATNSASQLKSAWILRVLNSSDSLREQVVLMWHNHFATSNLKVANAYAMWQQNELFRRHGYDSFDSLLAQVLRDPAMLTWLDAELNVKQAPNENLARELLELFGLGIGNYSEQDIKEVARALTGRHIENGQCVDDEAQHDGGDKSIFGQVGMFGPDDVVRLVANHPACPRRIAWRVCQHFLGTDIATKHEVDVLAEKIVKQKLSMGQVVETVIRSERFFDETTMGNRISPPVDFILAAVRLLIPSDRPSPTVIADWLAELGQDLFYPPNVGGWPGGRAWLSPQRLIARTRFATALTAGELASPEDPIPSGTKRIMGVSDSQLAALVLGRPRTLDQIKPNLSGPTATTENKARFLATLLALPEAQLD